MPRSVLIKFEKMANPKYAGLPGIAPSDEKDVYETDDLPEADQDTEFNESDSENIEKPHLNISAAHSKFKDKILICGKDVDFSDKCKRRKNTGYQAINGDWEIAAEGEKETLFQRFNRLQCEINEFIEDVNKLKEENNEESKKELGAVTSLVPQIQQSMNQLNYFLNFDGSGSEFMKFLSDPKESQIRKLLSKLENLKQSGKSEKESGKSKSEENNSMITYHLQTYPAQNKFIQNARLASLEERINKLESLLGTSSENLNRLELSEFKNLSQATKEIGARINLLDATQLDKLEGRLGALLSKMDSLAERKGGQEMIDQEKKVNELYDSLGKTEALNQSVKTVIERLIALNSLHVEAGEFKNSLRELETDLVNTSENISSNEIALKNVKETMEKHLDIVAKNIKSFDDRLNALKK